MQTWPSTLPAPENTVKIEAGSTLRSRKLESGRREVRRFGDGAPDRATVLFKFKADEFDEFVTFFEEDLNLGVNWFSAAWLSSVLGYSDHGARCLGYHQVKAKEPEETQIAVTLIMQKTGWISVADTDWPKMRT